MFTWLQRLLRGNAPARPLAPQPVASVVQPSAPVATVTRLSSAIPVESRPRLNPQTQDQAKAYLARIHEKINSLADSFSTGNINRTQFQELYSHYQREFQTVEAALSLSPESDDWKNAVTEGQSILIRHRNRAAVIGFSIYDNNSGMPVRSLGQFKIDPALFVPMLSSYQSATAEIFGGGIRSTQIEGGQWLCFVPGRLTTTLALFNHEPSSRQLKALDDLHVLFEKSNRSQLISSPINLDGLVCPHEYFMGHPL
ncbi:MAG TPA: hypothetical protein VGJ97_00850 [Anaerolineaceae bacterium]